MSHGHATLKSLDDRQAFTARHLGPRPSEMEEMLEVVGVSSLEELVAKTVPASILSREPLDLPPARSESEVLQELTALAAENRTHLSLIGLGYHNCITPPVIQRNVLENPGWYTAYTPYQAEISQGRLEALLNYQQMIMDLTGLPMANASLLDESTAAAEAMTLMHRQSKAKINKVFVAADCHPQTIAVIQTRARPQGIEVQLGNPESDLVPEEVFGAILQYPNTFGEVRDYTALCQRMAAAKAMVTVCCDLMSLLLLTPPGEWGADIAVGSAQRFGVPMGYGGPHAAFFATSEAYKRLVPGRIIGVSIDSHGKQAYRMALQTREQHIRRDKATSNICTAQALLANMAGFYAVWHGPEGLRRIAARIHRLTVLLAAGLKALGLEVETEAFFDGLTLRAAPGALERATAAGLNLRDLGEGRIGLCLDEVCSAETVEKLWSILSGKADHGLDLEQLDEKTPEVLPEALRRTSDYLTHPTFNSYRSETEMLRYLAQLREKDLALDRAMIPLGSCTMKLNATAEMMPISLPGFAQIHPFAPIDQAQGYRKLITGLEAQLCAITGFDAMSLQPNAGSQGEFAGLLTIKAYHEAKGDHDRTICLIPSSAHGTNPASAVMAGMKVVVVACDEEGNIDLEDLKAKAETHREQLAALMVTYPSTHGVFEEGIVEICEIIHAAGGQVYMDGANLNAQVGLCQPGKFGPDVAHLNLHKTFCIPHGGGGPGVGPIGVKSHLAPYLPNHPLVAEAGPETGVGPITAAPWGSAGILPISYAYIALTGAEGQKKATQTAILNANYIAARLSKHYKVLYKGRSGLVAHECILDTRPLKDEMGITVDDIAKRLIDFGFHAPTMSWPVAGTLMIEPTESESKQELDRFCEAMIAIKKEAEKVAGGEWPAEDNPLVNAPHTIESLAAADWSHPYSREEAAYPVASLKARKYWSPVGRIDNAYGDRNLVCSCPSLDSYQEAAE